MQQLGILLFRREIYCNIAMSGDNDELTKSQVHLMRAAPAAMHTASIGGMCTEGGPEQTHPYTRDFLVADTSVPRYTRDLSFQINNGAETPPRKTRPLKLKNITRDQSLFQRSNDCQHNEFLLLSRMLKKMRNAHGVLGSSLVTYLCPYQLVPVQYLWITRNTY